MKGKIKVIKKLREALQAERDAWDEVVDLPVAKTEQVVNDASAKTDRIIDQIEKMLTNAQDRSAGGPIPRIHGGVGMSPIVPGGAIGGASNIVISGLPDPSMNDARRDAAVASWAREQRMGS